MVAMTEFRDYHVRVWGGGDVSMDSPEVLSYATLYDVDGIQCNAPQWSRAYKEIYKAAQATADAFKRLDELIGKNEDERRKEW